MTEPIVFVSHFRIKEGKLEAFKQHSSDVSRSLEADKPRTSALLSYISGDGREVSFVHVFTDADAMDAHVQGADARSQAVYEFIEPAGWEVYGRPSADVMAMFQGAAKASGAPLVVRPEPLGGFLRVRSS